MSMEQKLYRQAGLDRAVEVLEEMAREARKQAEWYLACPSDDPGGSLYHDMGIRALAWDEAIDRIREEG